MPHFRIETNLPRSRIPKDFIYKAVPIVAKTIGKPEELCVVSVIPDVLMSFGGSSEACGIANFQSIGKLGVEENKKHAAVLYELVEKELGIPSDRMYITFQNSVASDIGYNNSTFHGIPI